MSLFCCCCYIQPVEPRVDDGSSETLAVCLAVQERRSGGVVWQSRRGSLAVCLVEEERRSGGVSGRGGEAVWRCQCLAEQERQSGGVSGRAGEAVWWCVWQSSRGGLAVWSGRAVEAVWRCVWQRSRVGLAVCLAVQ